MKMFSPNNGCVPSRRQRQHSVSKLTPATTVKSRLTDFIESTDELAASRRLSLPNLLRTELPEPVLPRLLHLDRADVCSHSVGRIACTNQRASFGGRISVAIKGEHLGNAHIPCFDVLVRKGKSF